MASRADSRTIAGVRLDGSGVDWPRLWFRPALRMDWANVRRFDVVKQVASWEDDEGCAHARPVGDRELRRRLDEAWSEHLVGRLQEEGELVRARSAGQDGTVSLLVTAAVMLLSSAGLVALGLACEGLDSRTKAHGVAALGVVAALLLAWLAWTHRELAEATAVRLDREGLHARGRVGGWRLVLSSARESTRGPRHWRRDLPWLSHPGPLSGLAGVPMLLLVGWARRAGRTEPVVPAWNAGRQLAGIGRRLVLFWAPSFGAGLFAFQRTTGFVEPKPWLLAGGIVLATAAFGAALWWLGHQLRDHWTNVGRRADELLERLGW